MSLGSLSSADHNPPSPQSPSRRGSFVPPLVADKDHPVPFELHSDSDETTDIEDLDANELRSLLRKERKKSKALSKELKNIRELHLQQQSRAEIDEEERVMKMLARMKELKTEKERIANELEREEELLVNTFRRKLKEAGAEETVGGKGLDDV